MIDLSQIPDAELVSLWKDIDQLTKQYWLEIVSRRLQRDALGQDYDKIYPVEKNFYHVDQDGNTYHIPRSFRQKELGIQPQKIVTINSDDLD